MKLIKKLLEQIPLEPCPKVSKMPHGYQLVMLANQVDYAGQKLLVATFYQYKQKTPYCRIFQGISSQITKIYDTGKWTSAGIENIYVPNEEWHSIVSFSLIADDFSARAGAIFFDDDGNKDTIKTIRDHQSSVRFKKIAKRNASDKNTTQKIMQHIPPLPEDMEKQILEGPMEYSRYLFYRRGSTRNPLSGIKEPTYFGYCTYCKKEHELSFIPKHRSEAYCPGCGSKVFVMARGISRNKEVHRCNYMVWGTVDTEVFARMFVVTRDYRGNLERIKTQIDEVERFYFNYGQAYKFTPIYTGWGENYELTGWEKKQQVTENYYNYDTHPHPKDIFKGTCAEHSHLDDYIEQCHKREKESKPMRYLAAYIKNPSIEHLLGCGLNQLVLEKVSQNNRTINQVVCWGKSRPREMLGVTQPEIEKIAKMKFNSAKILAYQKLKYFGVTLEEDSQLISLVADDMEKIMLNFERMGIKETVKYLKYQNRRWYGGDDRYRFTYYQWQDYKDTAQKLGYNMETAYNWFPPNLPKAHDSVATLLREQMKIEEKKRYEAEMEIWEEQYNALKSLCWEDGCLLIRPVKSQKELITEGEVLEHCVAAYAGRVRDGKTHILLIRRVEQPDVPYFTMNISTSGEFVQCHGYKNEINELEKTRPQFIKDFEQRWFAERVAPWIKKKNAKQRTKIPA